jgi:hypothetical protein
VGFDHRFRQRQHPRDYSAVIRYGIQGEYALLGRQAIVQSGGRFCEYQDYTSVCLALVVVFGVIGRDLL